MKISQSEINAYLAQSLLGKEKLGTFENAYVNSEDGTAEVILVRKILGASFTTSITLRLEQQAEMTGSMHHDVIIIGGKIGKLSLPSGFTRLILPAYENLAEVYREKELHHALDEMIQVTFEKDNMIFDPRLPDEVGMGAGF